MSNLLIDKSTRESSIATLILAHGAGAPMDSEFMSLLTEALNDLGVDVVRFEFPYMRERRATGKKRPPDRQPVLLECWRDVYQQVAESDNECSGLARPLLIGGKSMGGRMATLVAESLSAEQDKLAGICCFGYPFHPPGKPDKLRTAHLETTPVSTLIVQGTRDPFGKPDELEHVSLSEQVSVHWMDAGDHDLKPTVRSGFTHVEHIKSAAKAVSDFINVL